MPATIEIDEGTAAEPLDKQATINQAKQAQAAAAKTAVAASPAAGAEAAPPDEDAAPAAGVTGGFIDAYKKGLKTKQDATVEAKADAAAAPAEEYKQGTKSEDWKKLHARVKEHETKYQNLLKEFEAIKGEYEKAKNEPKIDPKELESIKTEKDQLLQRLETVALEQSPRFKSHYEKLFTEASSLAKEAVPEEQKAEIEDLLNMAPSKRRKAALDEVVLSLESESDKLNLITAFQRMDAARKERAEALADSKSKLTQIAEFEKTKAAEESNARKAKLENTISDVIKAASSMHSFTPTNDEQAERDRIESNKRWVRAYFAGELHPQETLLTPVMALEAKHLREKVVPTLEAENKELRESVARLTASTPGVGGETPPATSKPASFIEAYKNARKGRS